MKIAKITLNEYKPFIRNKNTNNTPAQENTATTTPILNAYRDYSINFRGRTPENFYAQEFNIKYMPQTMKEFLNSEYEERKHIPPEQLMSESFKFLAVTDNLADVKSTYPNETLFDNLHEASLKGRSGILSDIKLAKEMSDTPLINDGTDHLGIYLLRKIYLEGKTIREINKDFYENDLNPAYKGIVTQPITYGTTAAYGIQYPKTDFWNSFIATRDEYKKFFVNLPKHNKADLKKELTQIHNNHKLQENKPIHRKYRIKNYQKEQIKKEIIKTKGDENALRHAITKKFSKDDPEASFVVKYLSPIMTISADRIHLSEELRSFADKLKSNGNKIDNLFGQFWKTNPKLLEQYSTAITDTIDLFEETYENGGLLPINNEYQVITPETANQKAIDYVPQRFTELLDYVQTIVPNREQKYLKHAEEQKKWEEYFLSRYGEVQENEPLSEQIENKPKKTTLELLNEQAKANNAKVYALKDINGKIVYITANLDETFGDYIRKEYVGFPSNFIKFLTNRALKSPFMTEDAKLSFSTISIADKLDDERILGETERKYIMNSITSEIQKVVSTASMATLDALAERSTEPQKIYRTMFPNQQEEDTNEYSTILLKYYGEKNFENELNNLYEIYQKPLTNSEAIKITNIIMDYIRNFDLKFASSEKSVFYQNRELINGIYNFKEKCKSNKTVQKVLKNHIYDNIPIVTFSKSLLDKNTNPDLMKAKVEITLNIILNKMMNSIEKTKLL